MLKRIGMIIIILAIVFFGGFYAYKELMPPETQETQGPVYSTKEVIKGDISVGVETKGNLSSSKNGGIIVPGNRYERESVQYVIKEYLVEEGDKVKKGDVLVRLDSSSIEDSIEEKEEQLEAKREQLSDITGFPEDKVEFMNPYNGITIKAPISGRVTELSVEEGEELEKNIIARIIDDSKFEVKAYFTVSEYKRVSEGQKVTLSFDNFDGFYEGEIKEINPNSIPYDGDGEFARGFVHSATIVGENPGLVQRGMKVNIGFKDENTSSVFFISIPGEVEGFVEEEKVVNTYTGSDVNPIVTDVHVKNMDTVKEGDPIITMAGEDIKDDIEDYINEIRKLKDEIDGLKDQLNQLDITAPMDGIVSEFYLEEGETVYPGRWIGNVFNTTEMRMWCQVDDIDILNVQQGAPVKVTVDALPGKEFKGEVDNVSVRGEEINGVTKYMVDITIEGSDELKPMMPAKAFIDAGSAEDVLLVPLEAIFEEEGKTMVEILENGNPKIVQIELGLMNDRYAEVKEGLKEGDLVITGSSADLLPSQNIGSQDSILPNVKDDSEGEDNK